MPRRMKYGISGSSGSTGAIGSIPNSANIFSTSSEGVLDQGLIGDSGIPGTLTGTVLGECLRISFQSFIRANSTNWIPVVCTQPNNIFFFYRMHQHVGVNILSAVNAVVMAELITGPGNKIVPAQLGIDLVFCGKILVAFACECEKLLGGQRGAVF